MNPKAMTKHETKQQDVARLDGRMLRATSGDTGMRDAGSWGRAGLVAMMVLSIVSLLSAIKIGDADAGVRVRAEWRMGPTQVHVSNAPVARCGGAIPYPRRVHVPSPRACGCANHVIVSPRGPRRGRAIVQCHAPRPVHTPHDRRTAKRLASLTGYKKGYLLSMRRDGLSWRQISMRLDIPRAVWTACLSHDAYEDYVYRSQRGAGRVVVVHR